MPKSTKLLGSNFTNPNPSTIRVINLLQTAGSDRLTLPCLIVFKMYLDHPLTDCE